MDLARLDFCTGRVAVNPMDHKRRERTAPEEEKNTETSKKKKIEAKR